MSIVDEYRDLLVNRIGREKFMAFVGEVLLRVKVVYSFELEGEVDSVAEGAGPFP